MFVQLSQSLSVFAADVLTISVSDTGPKLVTKIFVLISVTFSVERAQGEMYEEGGAQRKAKKHSIMTALGDFFFFLKSISYLLFVSSSDIWTIFYGTDNYLVFEMLFFHCNYTPHRSVV